MAAGGFVRKNIDASGNVQSRVMGVLAVARSFGDNKLRKFIISEPQLHGPYDVRRFDTLVLACDGVWDVVSDATAARLALDAGDDVELAACRIRDKAYSRASNDNISVLVVRLSAARDRGNAD
eukprot:CAMPEP_0198352978 /NCGR_PEP_ID=MMETSP1450-20131203/109493_1 /TAXON_ID=753684 ORGANISM="Madagascaria erythrocladiodes, Strain CCMP3234" /NCGR_SAMPLE_ID=MMETSP1450 /ASSEMBLY_ACC=CAM_ASM_001115 /LENGTH=122 /DNA_ID=CAMNT_0044059073 /DNA_START=10 /DNA_END=375 /DNA_ORIENTATION=+